MRLCGVDAEDLAQMVAEIRALNPKPGEAFAHEIAQTTTPDILMRPHPGGGWLIELNPDNLPRVLVDTEYYAPSAALPAARRSASTSTSGSRRRTGWSSRCPSGRRRSFAPPHRGS